MNGRRIIFTGSDIEASGVSKSSLHARRVAACTPYSRRCMPGHCVKKYNVIGETAK